MQSFFDLCEQYDPSNTSDPKWELMDFLKSKGIKVSMVKGTDMLYIDTGSQTIPVTVSQNEEDAEMPGKAGSYDIDQEVEKLGRTANTGLKGLVARGLGTSAQRAKTATKKRANLAKKAIGSYERKTNELEKAIRTADRPVSVI